MAGIEIPQEDIVRASAFLDSVQVKGLSRYKYEPTTPDGKASPALTAEALLQRLAGGLSFQLVFNRLASRFDKRLNGFNGRVKAGPHRGRHRFPGERVFQIGQPLCGFFFDGITDDIRQFSHLRRDSGRLFPGTR